MPEELAVAGARWRDQGDLRAAQADGLEPEADFLTAVRLEERRIAEGWAPFWHYRALGRYGAQLRDTSRFIT